VTRISFAIGIAVAALGIRFRGTRKFCPPHKSNFVQSRHPFSGYCLTIFALGENPPSKSVFSFDMRLRHATMALPSFKVQESHKALFPFMALPVPDEPYRVQPPLPL
jgi:hypothetical protein